MSGVAAHRAALVEAGRCPACAERLSARALFGRAPCGACGARLADFGLDGHRVASAFERKGTKTVVVAAVLAAVVQLVTGLLPFADVVVALAIAGWLRFAILGPATAMMSTRRAVVSRLTARLLVGVLFSGLLVVAELLTLLGPLGLPLKAAIAAAQVFVGVFLVTRYVEAQLRREASGRPVEGAEVALLVAALALMMAAVAGLTLSALWVASTLQSFLGGLS